MITLKEIAKMCDVSPSTVSNILNGKTNVSEQTRQKVLDAIKESGYRPNFFAQSMRRLSSKIIAIVTEDLNEFSAGPIVESVMDYCEAHGYRTILMNLRLYHKWKDTWYEDDEKIKAELTPVIHEALSLRVDGLLYVAGHCRMIRDMLGEVAIPVVFAYGIAQKMKYPSVIIDDEKGGYDMTRHIISKGHRKIGLIGGVADNLHTKSRLMGYQKALFEANILYNPEWVRYGDWKRTSGYEAAECLIRDGVSAIFCMNDNMAAGAYDYLYEQGLSVGIDVSIAGYDNKEIAGYMRPALTTNELPLKEIGQKAAETLLLLLGAGENGKKGKKQGIIKLPCKMIERESVGTAG
ncbi:MAG: LacI family transcriptional regulator [Lachnospiraceae bacterium]|nr:LacI family transcriptional regulator [Lachnospiraceae bacterium]